MPMESGENKVQRFSKSWLCLALIILFVVFVRVRLSEFPLERDEGEYAYTAQLMLQGIAPYGEAYTMKFPGTALMYALIMSLFGQTAQGIHLGLILVNCVTILLLFTLCKRIVGDFSALAASTTYAILSLSSSVLGFAGHATHFVVLPAIGGSLLLLSALQKNKPGIYFLSGLLFGLATVMKQPGLFFVAFGASYIVYHYFSKKRTNPVRELMSLLLFMSGAFLPFFVTLVWLYMSGVFGKFWFWTVSYAGKYGTMTPLSEAVNIFKDQFNSVVDGYFMLWCFSAAGLIITLFHRAMKVDRVFILLFTAFSFLTVCPGLYFREHYFITFLPAVAILVGIFFDYWGGRIGPFLKTANLRFAGIAIFLVASGIGVYHQKAYFFEDSPATLSRNIYTYNPFPESLEIAKFIKSRSLDTDRVAVLGSEPQIYFYSQRHAATGYIYAYPLMENHDYSLTMQKEMISEIEASRPKFLVFARINMSWLVRSTSEMYIVRWIDEFIPRNYLLVGVADIVSPDTTVYKWDDDARNYSIQSPSNVLIYERR
jgi:4-amino-4-deoxy-L-arabinose transferase-like glycosyltransferase